jgi:DNA-directed RNA polymerase subunit B'/DNA-directed RNA polymerase subunit B
MVRAKIYINGKLTGYCDNPEEFTEEMRAKRRAGEINN